MTIWCTGNSSKFQGSPQLYWTDTGRMGQIRSSPEIGFSLQLTNFLHAKEAKIVQDFRELNQNSHIN
jgi:hypothetical protein